MIGINSYMKTFRPTYLYIKTHNKTGLKYFGKTTNDPYHYYGSGKHWLAHLEKHGYDISTKVIGFYETKEECYQAAIDFSLKNKIVESAEWANLILENGLDGGDTGRTNYGPMTDETKKKLSESKKGQKPWNSGLKGVTPGNKKPRTEEQKRKISESLTGRVRNEESVKKTAEKLRGRKRPEVSKKLKGRKRSAESIEKMKIAQKNKSPLSEKTKNKIREARKLQIITDETKEKLKGKIVCINKNGEIKKIDKEIFYSQTESSDQKEWVFHNSKEGVKRKRNGC